MKHHYNKEELIELKRKYDMQVRKEAIEEIKHTIDLDREIEDLKEQVEYQDLWREEYLSRINKAIDYIINQKLHKFKDTTGGLTYEERKLLEILEGEV